MEGFQNNFFSDHFSPSFLGQKYYSLSHIQSTVQTKVEFVIYWVLTLIGMSPENKKNAHHRSNFYNT